MPNFVKLEDTHNNYKGRYVRFNGRPRKTTDMKGKSFIIPTGAYGYCYSVNGATMYIAFKENLLLPPTKSALFSQWPFHITIRPLVDLNWELEKE